MTKVAFAFLLLCAVVTMAETFEQNKPYLETIRSSFGSLMGRVVNPNEWTIYCQINGYFFSVPGETEGYWYPLDEYTPTEDQWYCE